jgi:hypothetical protein
MGCGWGGGGEKLSWRFMTVVMIQNNNEFGLKAYTEFQNNYLHIFDRVNELFINSVPLMWLLLRVTVPIVS